MHYPMPIFSAIGVCPLLSEEVIRGLEVRWMDGHVTSDFIPIDQCLCLVNCPIVRACNHNLSLNRTVTVVAMLGYSRNV